MGNLYISQYQLEQSIVGIRINYGKYISQYELEQSIVGVRVVRHTLLLVLATNVALQHARTTTFVRAASEPNAHTGIPLTE